jgi:hypothetical protein
MKNLGKYIDNLFDSTYRELMYITNKTPNNTIPVYLKDFIHILFASLYYSVVKTPIMKIENMKTIVVCTDVNIIFMIFDLLNLPFPSYSSIFVCTS